MATKRRRNSDQLPMDFMLPPTDWTPPAVLPDLRGRGFVAMDLETRDDGLANDRGPGWVYKAGYITGVSMAAGDQSVYVPLRHPDTACHDRDAVRRWVRDHLLSSDRKLFHHAPYDLGWLWAEFDLSPPDLLDDTHAMAFILDEDRLSYSLDNVCRWQGVPGKDETMLRDAADAFGLDPKSEMWKLPAKYVGPYAAQDAGSTLNVGLKMLGQIEANKFTDAYRLECDIIPLCLEMRKRGIRIDLDKAEVVQKDLLSRRDEALRELSEKAAIGRQWTMKDVNSDGFLARIFDAAQVGYPKTKKGNDSFSTEWMEKRDHWLPQLVTKAMKMHDAGDKFVGQYIMNYSHMGRLHAEIHQFKDDRGGTRTSRFSYSDPPLQQMPARNPYIAKQIRGLFLPEPGQLWAALDYSQQEFRLMVHFASVCEMLGADKAVAMYQDDPSTDFHTMVAKLTGLPRRRAKDVNFAKAYGAGLRKFMEMTGMSEEEAKSVMGQYDDEMPFLSRLSEFCQKRADQRGYIRLLDGALGRFERWEPRWTEWDDIVQAQAAAKAAGRPLPELGACSLETAKARVADPNHPWKGRLRRAHTQKAMNTLIQGSAARQTKLAMRECWRAGIVPMLQMHDDLNFSLGEEAPARQAAELMTHVVQLTVPFKVDVEFGTSWGRAAADKETNYTASWDEAWAELQMKEAA